MDIYTTPCPGCFSQAQVYRKYTQEIAGGQRGDTWSCLKCGAKWHSEDIQHKILANLINLKEAINKLKKGSK